MRCLSVLFISLFLCLYPLQASALIDTVQVSNLSDINLPTWNIGDPAVTASIDICVYSISLFASPDYGVTISSPGGFFLKNGAQQIPYSLYWEDSGAGHLGSSNGTQLLNNTKLPNRGNANTLSVLCALGLAGPTARLYVKITQADMNAALAGTYNGTITILLSAD
jgi:hypothetical protein